MAHVELSLSEPLMPAEPMPGGLDRWASTVAGAPEPCMVIDSLSEIVAVSPSACRLLGFSSQAAAVKRHLFGGVLYLLDFTAKPSQLTDGELEKIPPVLAFSSRRLARGLMRVRTSDELIITVDAVASPLFEGERVVGSLTFFCPV